MLNYQRVHNITPFAHLLWPGHSARGWPWVAPKPWTNPRRTAGWAPAASSPPKVSPWEAWENPWANHGKTLGKHGKTMGKPKDESDEHDQY